MKTVAKTIGMAGGRSAAAALLAPSLAMVLALFSNVSRGGDPAPVGKSTPGTPASRPASRPARKNVKIPGLVINFQKRCVDIEGSICLDRGSLELIACTRGSKEHESIVAVKARPMHIHAALLLLGATPGNPAMRKPIDKEEKRWIDIPPKGDSVDVFLVFKNKAGKLVEHRISDFVTRSKETFEQKPGAGDDIEFPHTFLFAGSLLRSNGPGPRTYVSDLSGNVISIATFGDEVLCLPGIHGQEDGSLMWQVDATRLPKVGSKVTLRLRPKRRPVPKAGKAGQPRPVRPPAKGKH